MCAGCSETGTPRIVVFAVLLWFKFNRGLWSMTGGEAVDYDCVAASTRRNFQPL